MWLGDRLKTTVRFSQSLQNPLRFSSPMAWSFYLVPNTVDVF